MYNTDAMDTVAAFHWLVVNDRRPPRFSWTRGADGSLQVMPLDPPQSVLLWQATNAEARDFRLAILGPAFTSTPVEADARGMYTARVPAPERGWNAWFLELSYDVGAPKPLKLTTEGRGHARYPAVRRQAAQLANLDHRRLSRFRFRGGA